MQDMSQYYGKRKAWKIRTIYNVSRGRSIPINQLVKAYLNLSDDEERQCFEIDTSTHYETDNVKLLNGRRTQRGISQKEAAALVGRSEDFISLYEQGRASVQDIRLLYNLSKLYKIPLYVLIRNELFISDEEIARVIKFEDSNDKVKLETADSENEGIKEPFENDLMKLFAKIQKLSKSDLQVLAFMLIVFNGSKNSNRYSKFLNVQHVFDIATQISKRLDDHPNMATITEILSYMNGQK